MQILQIVHIIPTPSTTVRHWEAQGKVEICTPSQAEKNIVLYYSAMVCFKIQLGSLSGTVACSLYTAFEVDLTLVINLSSCLWHCIVQQ